MQVYTSNITNKQQHANRVKPQFADRNSFFLNSNIGFKGGMPKVAEAVKAFGEDFGEAAGKHFDEIIKKSGLKISSDDTITFQEQPFLKRALDIFLYPVKDMPIDLANGALLTVSKKFLF